MLYVATKPTCVPLLVCPRLRSIGHSPPDGGVYLYHSAHLWATINFVQFSEALGTLPSGSGYVATRPPCGPLPIFFQLGSAGDLQGGQGNVSSASNCGGTFRFLPLREVSGPPKRQGLCSHQPHLWATANFLPRSKALGPHTGGVMLLVGPLVGHF